MILGPFSAWTFTQVGGTFPGQGQVAPLTREELGGRGLGEARGASPLPFGLTTPLRSLSASLAPVSEELDPGRRTGPKPNAACLVLARLMSELLLKSRSHATIVFCLGSHCGPLPRLGGPWCGAAAAAGWAAAPTRRRRWCASCRRILSFSAPFIEPKSGCCRVRDACLDFGGFCFRVCCFPMAILLTRVLGQTRPGQSERN